MVATAVLALLLGLLLQVASNTLQATRITTQQADSTQSARRVIDALSRDIADSVTTSGAAILVRSRHGAPSLAFLTNRRGPSSSLCRFLAVNYEFENNQILRSYSAIYWEDLDLLAAAEKAAISPNDTSTLAVGVLQFAILALLEDGKTVINLQDGSLVSSTGTSTAWSASGTKLYDGQTVPTGWTALLPVALPPTPETPRVKALLVAIAALDEQNLDLLNTSQLAIFAQPTTVDPIKEWEAKLNSATFPGNARAAIRFQSRLIALP